jgi:hypothetical protein
LQGFPHPSTNPVPRSVDESYLAGSLKQDLRVQA